ncbi:MAG: hypothetical protein KAS07_02485 [Candidatus Pacebacteria bacterium]|nr:hypothetical protein [Candidatus Paceibacterota bacterium]
MTKKTTAIFLSVLVAVMPFLGFPTQFKTYFFLVSGLLLAGLIELISIQYCKECRGLLSHNEEMLDQYEDIEVSEKDEDDLASAKSYGETKEDKYLNKK